MVPLHTVWYMIDNTKRKSDITIHDDCNQSNVYNHLAASMICSFKHLSVCGCFDKLINGWLQIIYIIFLYYLSTFDFFRKKLTQITPQFFFNVHKSIHRYLWSYILIAWISLKFYDAQSMNGRFPKKSINIALTQ